MCTCWIRAVSSDGATSGEVAERLHRRARSAGEADGDEAEFARRLQRRENVGRASRGRHADEHVALAAEPAHLALEHLLEAVVVADGGERGGVGGKRKGRERRAVEAEAADQLGGDVLRVGGAAAIAGEHDLAAGAQRAGNPVGDRNDRRDQVAVGDGRARSPRASGAGGRGLRPHVDRPWRAPGSLEPGRSVTGRTGRRARRDQARAGRWLPRARRTAASTWLGGMSRMQR